MKLIKRIAAIDIGTNSFHLIVVELVSSQGRFRILDREKHIVRLGSGTADMKHLAPDAMERGIRVLRQFKMIADAAHAPVRAIATSAVREALNRDEFLRSVIAETGIKIEIASGFEEARLIHLGILQALPVFRKKILVIDIGGGSTEFIIGQGRNIVYSNSVKLGAVRLTQRFFPEGKFTKKGLQECARFVTGMLAPTVRNIRTHTYDVVVGSSGTIGNITNIARMKRGGNPDHPINNTVVSRKEISGFLDELCSKKETADRAHIKGLDPARADIIIAGTILLHAIMKQLHIPSLVFSDYALREGIILDTIEHHLSEKRVDHLPNIREASVLHLAETFHYEKNHAQHVVKLALQIFDQTKTLHKLGPREREFIEAAALLHEIGLYLSHAQHHRHSYYLIRNSELLGFTENEKEIIANVARYHRKSHPKLKHESCRMLSSEDQSVIRKLAAILRIADGLDRSHAAHVQRLKCRIDKRRLTIKLFHSPAVRLSLEVWGAETKKDLFEETFPVQVQFRS
jgi:exopolyphosphatase/guanosine-5'-triphosphate,3'-diphosphate pyrophosphatase